MNRLNSDEFKANYQNVLNLIREYNVHAYENVKITPESKLYDAILLRGYSNQTDKMVAKIEIEDQKFSLKNMDYQRIKLLDEKPMKICVSNGKNDMCDLIKGSKYMIKYIEIIVKKNGEIDIITISKDLYQKFRNELSYQSN